MIGKRAIWLIPLLGGSFVLGTAFPQETDRVDPARFFAKNCAACHTVPDTALETGRVWLDQVRRTT